MKGRLFLISLLIFIVLLFIAIFAYLFIFSPYNRKNEDGLPMYTPADDLNEEELKKIPSVEDFYD